MGVLLKGEQGKTLSCRDLVKIKISCLKQEESANGRRCGRKIPQSEGTSHLLPFTHPHTSTIMLGPKSFIWMLWISAGSSFQSHPSMLKHHHLSIGNSSPRHSSAASGIWSKKVSSSEEQMREDIRRSEAIGGTGLEGKSLLLLGLLICLWGFSVPPEFRRSRFCSEAQIAENPDSMCITGGQFVNKVVDYYSNGGGIQWDFSIAQETKEYFDR